MELSTKWKLKLEKEKKQIDTEIDIIENKMRNKIALHNDKERWKKLTKRVNRLNNKIKSLKKKNMYPKRAVQNGGETPPVTPPSKNPELRENSSKIISTRNEEIGEGPDTESIDTQDIHLEYKEDDVNTTERPVKLSDIRLESDIGLEDKKYEDIVTKPYAEETREAPIDESVTVLVANDNEVRKPGIERPKIKTVKAGFRDTLNLTKKTKLTANAKKTNVSCSEIYQTGKYINQAFYFPSEFPNLTKLKNINITEPIIG